MRKGPKRGTEGERDGLMCVCGGVVLICVYQEVACSCEQDSERERKSEQHKLKNKKREGEGRGGKRTRIGATSASDMA